jgi:hypothetical protein
MSGVGRHGRADGEGKWSGPALLRRRQAANGVKDLEGVTWLIVWLPYHEWISGLVCALPDMCQEIRSIAAQSDRMIAFEWPVTREW